MYSEKKCIYSKVPFSEEPNYLNVFTRLAEGQVQIFQSSSEGQGPRVIWEIYARSVLQASIETEL